MFSRHDIGVAQQTVNQEERKRIFNNLRSATESGWDFSSRWLIRGQSNSGNELN